MDSKSPKDRVIPIPNGRTSWLVNGGLLTTYKSWDDPPSSRIPIKQPVGFSKNAIFGAPQKWFLQILSDENGDVPFKKPRCANVKAHFPHP